ncbi:MAG: hypothetical protein AAGG68_21020 [Bacteroidota bacterium]
MNRIQIIILATIGSIAVLQGLGLKVFVPMMKTGLDTMEILIISGISAILFLPFILGIIVSQKWWHFLPIALFIGTVSGLISGYFWDGLLSNLLIGLLSVFAIYASSFVKIKLLFKVVLCFLFLALFTLGINIVGHSLSDYDAVFYFQLSVVTLKDYLLCGALCAWLINKFDLPQMAFET